MKVQTLFEDVNQGKKDEAGWAEYKANLPETIRKKRAEEREKRRKEKEDERAKKQSVKEAHYPQYGKPLDVYGTDRIKALRRKIKTLPAGSDERKKASKELFRLRQGRNVNEDVSDRSKKLFADAKAKLEVRIHNLKNHIHELDPEKKKIAEKRLQDLEAQLTRANKGDK